MRTFIRKYWRHPGTVIAMIIVFAVVLTYFTQTPDYSHMGTKTVKEDKKEKVIVVPPPKLITPTPKEVAGLSRRISVAGQPGYTIVVQPDGSSYLEGPDGKMVRQLADASPLIKDDVIDRISQKLITPTEKRPSLGQLIVCDNGVVDVPTDAVITFIGTDRVVTHSPDGTSNIYYTSGKIETRGQIEREKKVQ
jgi:hypothetical protein